VLVSVLTPLIDAATSRTAPRTSLAAVAISCAVAVTLWIDAAVSSIAAPVSVRAVLNSVVFAFTCSIDAAISFTDEDSPSINPVTVTA